MIVLSEDEVVELTGKRRPSAQTRVLDFMGIPYRPRPDGTLVLRIHVEGHRPADDKIASPEPRLVFDT